MSDRPKKYPKKCVHCGVKFDEDGEEYHHWFSCETCGAVYIERADTGEWYEEDEYHATFDDYDQSLAESRGWTP